MKGSKAFDKAGPDYCLKAVIDIGSTSIRMVVAQVHADGRFQTLDALNQSVTIGSDTFTHGRISRGTISDCVKALRNFSSVIKEYGIRSEKDIRAVATSAVREARNREEFLDRITIATGMRVEVIDGIEVNRLTFLAIQPVLKAHPVLRRDRLLVVKVGGGSSEWLGLDEAKVSFAHTYRMGSYRLRETMETLQVSKARQREVLEMEIGSMARHCLDSVGRGRPKLSMLLLGGEARFVAKLVQNNRDEESLVQFQLLDLIALAERILKMDVTRIAHEYRLYPEEAHTLGPALLAYARLMETFELKTVSICGVSLRDGLVAEAATGGVWSEDFVEQILHSVREIGRRYRLDQAHADCVTEIAKTLFRVLQDEHRLDYRGEVILIVAAQLHDVGMFIASSSHHKHSKYLIEHSEIFGLGEEDIKLVALVARYHRRASPRTIHPGYNMLQREQRLLVNKLAAILRVADAMDQSHTQAVKRVEARVSEKQIILEVSSAGDFTIEKRALADKEELFAQVYGRTVVLRSKRKR